MLTSITPLGERGRSQRWSVTITAYAIGCLLGGATTGVALGALGGVVPRLPAWLALALAGAVCLLAAAVDLAPGPLPGGHRQVDEDWLTRYRGWVYGAGFGYQLGLGVVTVVTSAATYAVLAVILLTQSWLAGLAIGTCFGLARCLPAVSLGRTRSHTQIRSMASALEQHARTAARVTAGALAVAGGVLLAGSAL